MISVLVAGVWLASAAPAVSAGDRAEAIELADRAEALRDAGKLEEAREALARAHDLDPNPYFLFGLGRLAGEAGDCEEAIALLREFLAAYPDADGTAEARAEIARCGGAVEGAGTPDPEPPSPPPPSVPVDATPPDPVHAPWQRDPAGGVLLGVGLASLVVGAGLYGGAAVERNGAADAPTTDGYRDTIDRTRRLETGAITALAIGGVLAVGAVIRYAIVARRARQGVYLRNHNRRPSAASVNPATTIPRSGPTSTARARSVPPAGPS